MPPGAERREEADKPGAESHNKKNGSPKKNKGRYVKISFLRISRCRGLSPAGRFLRGEKPLKLPKHLIAK